MLSAPGLLWLALALGLLAWGLVKKDAFLALSAALALNAIFVPHTADYDLAAFSGLLLWLGGQWLFAKKYGWLAVWGFVLLLLFPWISLIAALQTIADKAVEAWYSGIWRTYPIMLLAVCGLTILVQTRAGRLLPHNPR